MEFAVCVPGRQIGRSRIRPLRLDNGSIDSRAGTCGRGNGELIALEAAQRSRYQESVGRLHLESGDRDNGEARGLWVGWVFRRTRKIR